jgi:hypothetical protein
VASAVEPSGMATATALLVVPKSSPTTVDIGKYPSSQGSCVRIYAETPPTPVGEGGVRGYQWVTLDPTSVSL